MVTQFTMTVRFDPEILSYRSASTSGTLTSGWSLTATAVAPGVEALTFTSLGGPLGTSGVLAHLQFQTYVADITVQAPLPGRVSNCAVEFVSPEAVGVFAGKDVCGAKTLRGFMGSGTIAITAAQASHADQVIVEALAAREAEGTLTLVNMLGETVATEPVHLHQGANTLIIRGLSAARVTSGTYIVRLIIGRTVDSKLVEILR